jgi:hypothetical protein
MDNIQGVFFSKENISNLNKDLLEKLKIKNLSQEIRKDIVETIVDNMKQTWSKIDKTKVNNNNINNILSQFNSYSSDQSHITLKNKYNSNYTGIHSNTSQQQNIPNQKQQNIPNQKQQNIPNQQQYASSQKQQNIPNQQQQNIPRQQQQNIPRQQQQNIPSPQQQNIPSPQQQNIPRQQQQNIPRQQQQNIPSQQQYAPSQQQYAPSQQQVNNDLNQFYNNINPNIPDNFIDPDYNSSSLKFQRDFTINQGKQNQIPDRSTSILGANEKYIRNAQETQRLASNFQPSIDNVFKPLIDNDQLESGFNNYNFNKNEGDVKQKMDDVRFNRENEIYMPKKQQNEIPDFLKPKCTSIRTPDEYKNTIQVNQLKEKEQNPNIKTKKSIKSGSQSNNEFLSGLNDFSEDLMSINNFDKKITDDNIEEDNTPFSDRLSRLKADRDSVNVPRSGKIDFTSEHFEDTYDDIEPTTIKDLIKKKNKNEYEIEDDVTYDEDYELNQRKQYETNQREQYETNQREQYETNQREQYESRQKEQYELNQRKQYESRQREQYESKQHDINNKDQNSKNIGNKDEIKELYLNYLKLQKNNEILTNENNILKKNTSKKLNKNEKKEYMEIFNDLKKINDKISEELKNNKTEKNMYINELNSLKEKYTLLNENYILLKEVNSKPKELIDLEKIKNDISSEFKELSNIKEENEQKINLIKKEQNDLEITINEYKTIIEEFNKINNTKFYQMEIHNENFSSYYTYNFEKLDNIASIKLLSYSIPSINFNIEEDKNNIFEFEFEANNVIEIKLESGKYGIDELLNSLNKNEYGLIFSLDNITQKVTVSSEKEFKINPSPLSISNLFFTDNNYENLKEYKATKIFDLRSDNKISLYLNNIDNNSPFAILYPESTSNAILNFENLISLEKLDILFKDSKGRIHNFYNSEHNISLQLEVKN